MTENTTTKRVTQRIPLNTLAISLGAAGLASLWSAMTTALGLSVIVPGVLWSVAGATWLWLVTAHLARGSKSSESLLSQLKHPAQGPIAAIVPTVGMLLGAELYLIWPVGGFVLALIAFVMSLGFAGWLLAFWHTGHLNPEAFHGGYLLPTVASPLVAAAVAARFGFPHVAMGAFAVGIFFWGVLITVLLSRLAFFPPLPDPLTPTLSILLAPPAVAGIAWFAMNGAMEDVVSVSLLGLLAIMAVLQLFLLGVYRHLSFSLGWWSFTFPVAAAASYAVQWAEMLRFAGWAAVAFVISGSVSVFVLAIAIRSVLLISSVRRGVRRAEETLQRADDEAQRSALTKAKLPNGTSQHREMEFHR